MRRCREPISAPIYARVGDAPACVMVAIALFVVVRRRLARQSGYELKLETHNIARLWTRCQPRIVQR